MMTNVERYNLWQFSELYQLAENISIVRNNIDGRIMVKRISSGDNFSVMERIAKINHPNLMRVYDCILDNGKCISLSEYIEGTILERAVLDFTPYNEQAVKNIMAQLCDGLSELHRCGIIHRDINPSNVMLDKNGIVKIIDFDITRTVKENKAKDTRVLGTAGYASPEQFGFSQTNERADIYSCGVLMNFLLTGKLPSENLYSGNYRPIICRCIEIDENKRYENTEQLKNALFGKNETPMREPQKISFLEEFPKNIPGFRTGKKWQKVLTVICYIYYFLFLFSFVTYMPKISDSPLWEMQVRMSITILVFWSAVPYICLGDFGNISRVINRRNPKKAKNLLKIIGILSFAVGFLVMMSNSFFY